MQFQCLIISSTGVIMAPLSVCGCSLCSCSRLCELGLRMNMLEGQACTRRDFLQVCVCVCFKLVCSSVEIQTGILFPKQMYESSFGMVFSPKGSRWRFPNSVSHSVAISHERRGLLCRHVGGLTLQVPTAPWRILLRRVGLYCG